MPPRKACPSTPSLFDWTPPDVVQRIAPEKLSGGTYGRLLKALSLAISESELSRAQVAEKIGRSKDMLDRYLSPGAEAHKLQVQDLVTIIDVLADPRPLAVMLQDLGFVIVEKRFEALIQAALTEEKIRELTDTATYLKRRAKIGGRL